MSPHPPQSEVLGARHGQAGHPWGLPQEAGMKTDRGRTDIPVSPDRHAPGEPGAGCLVGGAVWQQDA